MLHLRLVALMQGAGEVPQLVVLLGAGELLCRKRAAEVLLHHGDRAGDEVAEIICKVSVDAGDQKLVGEISVGAEGEAAQQEEAQCIRAVALSQQIGIDDVALGLGHFAAVEQQPAVTKDLFRQRHTHAHEHGGPDNGVETHDLLADKMHVRRPEFIVIVVLFVQEAQRGGVVEQCVHPDIDHMAWVKVHGDAPFEARARDAEILQTGVDEILDHLVDAAARLEEIGVQQQIAHGLCVLGKTEEIGFLLGGLALAATVRALAVLELAGRPERLAGRAVHALVGALVDVAVFIHFAEDFLHGFNVVIIRRADEAVVGNVHQLPKIEHALLAGDDVIDVFLRCDACGGGLGLDLLAVLVSTGEEHHVVAAQTLVTRHGIGRNGAVGVADVQLIRGIVDRRGDIELFLTGVAHIRTFFHELTSFDRGDEPHQQNSGHRTGAVYPDVADLRQTVNGKNLDRLVAQRGEQAEEHRLEDREFSGVAERAGHQKAQQEILDEVRGAAQNAVRQPRKDHVGQRKHAVAFGIAGVARQKRLQEHHSQPKKGEDQKGAEFVMLHNVLPARTRPFELIITQKRGICNPLTRDAAGFPVFSADCGKSTNFLPARRGEPDEYRRKDL